MERQRRPIRGTYAQEQRDTKDWHTNALWVSEKYCNSTRGDGSARTGARGDMKRNEIPQGMHPQSIVVQTCIAQLYCARLLLPFIDRLPDELSANGRKTMGRFSTDDKSLSTFTAL